MKFDVYHLPHFGSQLFKKNNYFFKREEILLSMKPIYRMQTYGILVSFSDITMSE
jgi:hypothetical protein